MKRACTPSGASELIAAVRRLYAAIERFDARVAAALGIDRTALRALDAMERGPLTASELGAALGLTSGSVTALVDRLQRAGHAERHVGDTDRRQRTVALARGARDSAGRHYGRLGQRIEGAFDALDPQARRAAVAVLDVLAESFDGEAAEARTTATALPRERSRPTGRPDARRRGR